MKRGMTFGHGDECPATSRAHFSASGQSSFDGRASLGGLDHFGRKMNRTIGRRRPQKLDRVISSNRARRTRLSPALHQMPGGSPIAMAIEQRADDPAVQNAGKRLIFFLRFPLGDHFIAARETADVQTFRIRRTATKAMILRRKLFLKRLRFRWHFFCSGAL